MLQTSNPELLGHVRSSNAENKEHETALFAKRITEIPSNMQLRVAYSGSNAEYVGFAPRGLAAGAEGWLIQKFTYSGSDVTLRQIAYDNWDNRASATYA